MKHRPGPISPIDIDVEIEVKLRPRRLVDFIGQDKIKENLHVFMQAA